MQHLEQLSDVVKMQSRRRLVENVERAGGKSLLEQMQSTRVVRCDEAAWRFLGLSLAGYNVLISLALAVVAIFAGVVALKNRPVEPE